MDIADRIERLENAIKEAEAQRDWLLEVKWSDSNNTAEQAAKDHDRVIATYEKLIKELKERDS